jgi:hypothetical protein
VTRRMKWLTRFAVYLRSHLMHGSDRLVTSGRLRLVTHLIKGYSELAGNQRAALFH